MLLSVNLDDLEEMKKFSIQKAIDIAKMINSEEPKIQFLLNDESLVFTVKDKLPESSVLGKYYYPHGKADIYVDSHSTHELLMGTVIHEFAHHLQHKSMINHQDWTTGFNHPQQDALYQKYKELCRHSYASCSPKEMAAEAFRLLMGWEEAKNWELNQSFREDWFEFFYSEELFQSCLSSSLDENVRERYFSKLIEEFCSNME
jgi:hypothetical protein